MHKDVPLAKIIPNPFRKMDRYPIREEKIEMLRGSIKRTGFWDNVVGRERNGHVELAYGHHRWIAFEREHGKKAKMKIIILDLNDEDMIRIMAEENANEYGSSTIIEQETIRAVVEAFAEGKIQLPKPKRIDAAIRYAPSFMKENSGPNQPAKGKPYTADTIAMFLGWTKSRGKGQGLKANHRITNPLAALEVMEEGLVDEEDYKDLTSCQAQEIAHQATQIKRTYDTAAKNNGNPVQKKKLKRKGREVAKRAAKKAAKSVRPDPKTGKSKAGMQQIKNQMEMARHENPKAIPRVEKFVSKLTGDLDKLLGAQDPRWIKLMEVVKYRDNIEDYTKKNLTVSLKCLIARSWSVIDAIEGNPQSITLEGRFFSRIEKITSDEEYYEEVQNMQEMIKESIERRKSVTKTD